MHWDGKKLFFAISVPTKDNIKSGLPHFELTSPASYSPGHYQTCRRLPSREVEDEITDWQERLDPPREVVKSTLAYSTRLAENLECETHEYMCDHYQTRLHQLRPKRLSDTLYVDTFFSSVVSVRGFAMFNVFALKKAHFDKVYFLK